jgi:hypothetical protein
MIPIRWHYRHIYDGTDCPAEQNKKRKSRLCIRSQMKSLTMTEQGWMTDRWSFSYNTLRDLVWVKGLMSCPKWYKMVSWCYQLAWDDTNKMALMPNLWWNWLSGRAKQKKKEQIMYQKSGTIISRTFCQNYCHFGMIIRWDSYMIVVGDYD